MNTRSIIRKTIVILFWVGLWAIAAAILSKPLLLPDPISVFARIFTLSRTADFWFITFHTLLRIMIGIMIATVLGVLFGIITHYSRFLRELFAPILTIVKVTPVASFIILALIWIGRDTVPAVIAGLMVLPVVWTNVGAGLRNIDSSLLEMAEIYHLSPKTKFVRITVPSVMPYFLAAVETSVGIGWKAGIAAEVLTVPVRSIGKMIYESKMYLETIDLFAWTIVVVVISLLIEKCFSSILRNAGQRYNSEVISDD